MTTPPQPPSYPPYGAPPPYGPPPYGPQGPYGPQPPYGPPPQKSSATMLTALLAVLFVAATTVVAIVLHLSDDAPTASTAPAGGTSGAPGPGAAGSSYAAPSYTPPTYSPPTSYVPSPTSTRRPLDGETINRTFQVYMNALLNRSLSQLRSATCPRLRGTLRGTALDGKYINRWQSSSYRIYDSLDYVIIPTRVRYINPNTGGNGGSHTYRWYVERYPDGRYWVCGITG